MITCRNSQHRIHVRAYKLSCHITENTKNTKTTKIGLRDMHRLAGHPSTARQFTVKPRKWANKYVSPGGSYIAAWRFLGNSRNTTETREI